MPIFNTVETNTDLLTANLFTFEIIGRNMKSPNFSRVEGITRTTESVEQADGGTGLIKTYHGGVVRHEPLTIVRVRDNTENDKILSDLVIEFAATAVKVDGNLVKRHKGEIIRNIEFSGMSALSEILPSYDNITAAPEEMSYTMAIDWYEEIF